MSTTVKHDEQGNANWGSEDHLLVSQNRSFVSMVFELLSERIPTEKELKIFELILNLSIDHGPDTPSAVATVEVAKKGKTISEAVAAGINKIDDIHGGAQEQLMEILYEIRDKRYAIRRLVEEYLGEKKRMPGYGHRIYKDVDPRAGLILNTLRENGFSDEFINIAQGLETELEKQKGAKLPLNIDGAIAVVLCSFGWEPSLGKAVFIIARTPGLCGQFLINALSLSKISGVS